MKPLPLRQAAALLALSLGLLGARALTPGETLLQDGVAYRSEGRQLQEAGDLPRAAAAYRRAVMVHPKYAEAYNDLGVILESMGELKHAEEAYQTALRLKPEFGWAHSNLALLYEEMGKVKEAGEHWAARIRLGPPEDFWVAKAREKLTAHNLPVLTSAVESAENRKEEIRQALRTGQAHLDAKRWPQAEAEFERVLSWDSNNKQAQRLLRVTRSAQEGEQEKLSREMEASRRAVIKEAEVIRKEKALQQAEAERKSKKTKTAVKKVKVVQKPVETPSVIEPIPTAAPKDALALAQEYAREKSQTRKKTAKELLNRAMVAMREGSYREAADQYKQILLLEPTHREARQGLDRATQALVRQENQQAR